MGRFRITRNLKVLFQLRRGTLYRTTQAAHAFLRKCSILVRIAISGGFSPKWVHPIDILRTSLRLGLFACVLSLPSFPLSPLKLLENQMKNHFLIAALATTAIATTASASLLAGWTMPTAVPSATTGSNYNYGAADLGDMIAGSMLSGSHAAAATTWSSPAGNGSTYSLSSNNWAIGDYYQVAFSTVGAESIVVSWDQTRSSTGPSTFSANFSIDGGATWSAAPLAYTVVQAGLAGTGTTSWNTVTNQAVFFTTSFTLDSSANNRASVLVRLSTTVTTSAAGTNRVDNIMVNGVPAPGAIALLGLAGFVARRRRN